MLNVNTFSCDYLTFTIKNPFSDVLGFKLLDWFIDILHSYDSFFAVERFEFCNYGFNTFNRSAKFSGQTTFMICTSDSGRMSNYLMVSVSGMGIKDIGSVRLNKLIEIGVSLDANFTRLDLCYDDFNKTFPLKKFINTFQNFINGEQNLETHFKRDRCQIINSVFNNIPYTNVTFGSRTSIQYLRLYDKRAEQGLKGFFYDLPLNFWYRLEFECRHDLANAVAEYLVKSSFDYSTTFKIYINRMFRILDHSANDVGEINTKSRIDTASWWFKFIDTSIKGASLYIQPDISKNVDQMLDFISDSFGGYLYTLNKLAPDRLFEIIKNSVAKANKAKYRHLLDSDGGGNT